MKRIILRATLVATITLALSVFSTWSFGVLSGNEISLQVMYLSVITPIIVAFLTGAILEAQKQNLLAANEKLKAAHHRLSLAHAAVEHRSQRDGLTGLFNRDYFFDFVNKLHQRGCMATLLMIDADHFKKINDTYGHVAGDEALRMLANAIGDSIRPDDLVGRIGGEEFAVFLRDSTTKEAIVVAERIRGAVASLKFMPTMAALHPLTVSIGGAELLSDRTVTDTMREADAMLYQAKDKGRNCVVFAGKKAGDRMLEVVDAA